MTSIGFDKPLYLLPFDHRCSFQTQIFGWRGPLTFEQRGQVAAAKRVVYDGFKTAVAAGVPKGKAGILVDEQFGAAILHNAAEHGYTTCCPAEKSGQEEFNFQFGDDFDKHIEAFHPTFCKVLVRYNPEGDRALNARQLARLKRLSEYLHNHSRSLFMFDLLVPPLIKQLDLAKGEIETYDLQIRPRLMVTAIEQLQNAEVEPDVWKVEGLSRREDCVRIVAAARRGGRTNVGCMVLGRGEGDLTVRKWLVTAAAVRGFIGFAIGRTVFWEPLTNWRQRRITREDAVAAIARRYRHFANLFEETAMSQREENAALKICQAGPD